MKQIAVDSSIKKLSTEALTLQIGCAESPLASFLLVLSFYGESLGGRGFVTVLPTIVLQAPLDRARGELPSDSRTLISHWEKFRGKTGEIWRSVIATCSFRNSRLEATNRRDFPVLKGVASETEPTQPIDRDE